MASTPALKNPHVITQCSKELGVVLVVKKKQDQNESGVAQALTAFTQVLTGATKTVPLPSGQGVTTSSPARLIESRSKLYKQLSELQNLKSAGILTESEYATEKETIMDLLKQLKGK